MAGKEYSLKAILSATDKISPTLKKIDSNFGKIQRSFSSLGKASAALASKFALPLTALGGLSGFGIKSAIDNFTCFGDSIDKASKRAGVSAESLQKLRYAADLGGMSAEEMDKALGKLTDNMGKAARGENKNLAAIFKRLGVSLKDSKGNIRDAADVMRNLAQAVKNNESPAARMRILTAAFGDELAKKMVPVLESGADGLDSMGKEAEKLGLILGQDTVNNAAHLNDTLSVFSKVMDNMSVSIGASLSPVIEKIVGKIQNWVVANKDLIAQRLEKIFQKISDSLEKIDFEKVVDGVFDCIEGFGRFMEDIGGWETVLKGFGAVLAINLVGDLASLGKSVASVGTALSAAFGPWGLIASAVVAAGIMIWKNWDTIAKNFEETFPNLSKVLKGLPDGFSTAWDNACKNIRQLWDDLQATWDKVKNTFTWDGIKGSVRESLGFSREEAKTPIPQSLTPEQISALGRGQYGQRTEVDNRLEVLVKVPNGTEAEINKQDSNGGYFSASTQQYALSGLTD